MKTRAYKHALGARLRLVRKGLNLKPTELAPLIGCKTDTYGKYESGAREMPLETLVRFIRATHADPWLLLSGTGDAPSAPQDPPQVHEFRRLLLGAPQVLWDPILGAAKLARSSTATDPRRAAAFKPAGTQRPRGRSRKAKT
jgi:transcriptional regulator with XRE-family HTH domain